MKLLSLVIVVGLLGACGSAKKTGMGIGAAVAATGAGLLIHANTHDCDSDDPFRDVGCGLGATLEGGAGLTAMAVGLVTLAIMSTVDGEARQPPPPLAVEQETEAPATASTPPPVEDEGTAGDVGDPF
jgi:hypothetical protein